MFQVKFIRDDKKVFALGGSYADTAAWGITKISGIGQVDNEIATEQFAIFDGAIITGERVADRLIEIEANVKRSCDNLVEKMAAKSFFLPRHTYTIYITNDDGTKWIVGVVKKVLCPQMKPGQCQTIALAILCPDPYFYSNDNYGKNIAAVTAGFGFPYISPIKTGFAIGTYNFAKQVKIENYGDTDTYLTIHIEASGEVHNPKIIKDGYFIRVKDVLQNGDVLDIDLVSRTIKKNGINCIGKVDRASSFSNMKLDIGDNIVSFAADNGDNNMKVVLYYNLRYLEA